MPNATKAISAIPIAVVLLASGCGSGKPASANRPPTSTAQPLNVGASATPAAASTGTPTGSAKPAASAPAKKPNATPAVTPVPIPDDPAKAVAAWLSAVDGEDYASQRNDTTEGANVLMVIRDIIRQANTQKGASTDNQVQTQDAPKTLDVSGDVAHVSFKVNVHSIVSGPKQTLPEDTPFEGPATLKRKAGAWRIADFTYGGTPLAPAYYPVDTKQTVQDVVLYVAAIQSYKRTTAAVIRFFNQAGGNTPLHVKSATFWGAAPCGTPPPSGAACDEQPLQQLAFEPVETPYGFLGFSRTQGKPKRMQVTVENSSTHAAWTYTFDFA